MDNNKYGTDLSEAIKKSGADYNEEKIRWDTN